MPKVWSFSSIELFNTCPLAWKYKYIDRKFEEENNFYSEYGLLSHTLFEEYLKGETPIIALGEEYEDRFENTVVHSPPPFPKGQWKKYYDEGLDYFNNFVGFGTNYEPVSVEEKFQIDIGGYKFVGIADAILRDKTDGSYIIIDHKSKTEDRMRKDYPIYVHQLYIYAAFVKQKYGVYPKKLMFNCFRSNVMIGEDFSTENFDETMDWIVKKIHEIISTVEFKDRLTLDVENREREGKKPRKSHDTFFCRWLCSSLLSCPRVDDILNK